MHEQFNTPTPSPQRFDHVWHAAVVVAYERLCTFTRRLGANVKEVRRHAYRFTKGVIAMQKHYQDELIAMIASEGVTVQRWMDDHFEIIEGMGDTRERIFAAVEAGVTEREYVAQGEIVLGRKRIKTGSGKATATDAIPAPSVEPMTAEERAEHFRDLYDSMVSKFQAIRREHREALRHNALLERRVVRLECALKRAEKNIEAALHVA